MPISRATENDIYVVMANAPADPLDINRAGSSHGESKIIHPNGNVMVEAGIFTDEIIIRKLDLHQASRNIALRAVNDINAPARMDEKRRKISRLQKGAYHERNKTKHLVDMYRPAAI